MEAFASYIYGLLYVDSTQKVLLKFYGRNCYFVVVVLTKYTIGGKGSCKQFLITHSEEDLSHNLENTENTQILFTSYILSISLGKIIIFTKLSFSFSLSLKASTFNFQFLSSPVSIRDRLKKQKNIKHQVQYRKENKKLRQSIIFSLGTNIAFNSTRCQAIYQPSNIQSRTRRNEKY